VSNAQDQNVLIFVSKQTNQTIVADAITPQPPYLQSRAWQIRGSLHFAVSALSVPSLTTVRQPLETMGGAAVNIVMEAIKAGHENRDWSVVAQKLHAELVIRDSTQAI